MKYAQNKGKTGIFINRTTVLPAFALMGTYGGFFGVGEAIPPLITVARRAEWQDRRIVSTNPAIS